MALVFREGMNDKTITENIELVENPHDKAI